jgi:hypothetical protein
MKNWIKMMRKTRESQGRTIMRFHREDDASTRLASFDLNGS